MKKKLSINYVTASQNDQQKQMIQKEKGRKNYKKKNQFQNIC